MEVVSVSVKDEVRKRMKQLEFVNWSNVANEAFAQKIMELEILEAFSSKSKLTEKDAEEIAAKINAGVARRFEQDAARKKRRSDETRG